MTTEITGYCHLTVDQYSLTDSTYQLEFSTYRKDFDTLDSANTFLHSRIVSSVNSSFSPEDFKVTRIVPKTIIHPITKEELDAKSITEVTDVNDSSYTESDIFEVGLPTPDEYSPIEIQGISSLRSQLKECLKNKAEYIATVDKISKVICSYDSDGFGNTVDMIYVTEELDSNTIIFSKDEFNV